MMLKNRLFTKTTSRFLVFSCSFFFLFVMGECINPKEEADSPPPSNEYTVFCRDGLEIVSNFVIPDNACTSPFICTNGIPFDGSTISPNRERCDTCDDDYILDISRGSCVPAFNFVCANGTVKEGQTMTENTQRKIKTSLKQSLEMSTVRDDVKYIISKVFEKVKTKKEDKKVYSTDVFTREQINLMLENSTKRISTLIMLLNKTGLRVSELLNIKYTDIKVLTEKAKGKDTVVLNVLGKGQKERRVYLLQDDIDTCKDVLMAILT